MHIASLELTHFRNYTSLELELVSGINCIYGSNGAGKTNILDALHYLAFTRSLRGSNDKQVVEEGAPFFVVKGQVKKDNVSEELQCNFVKGKGKKVLVDQKPLKKLSEHIGSLPLVAILPGDTDLINGPSAGRRRFLDMLISQYSPSYLTHLIQYDRLLAQRNAQLKLFAAHGNFDSEQLELWDAQLVPHGKAIFQARTDFIADFQPIFEQYFKKIVAQQEVPSLHYHSQITENTIDHWLARYKESEQKDRYNLYTSVGIHRDDLRFKIDKHSVKDFGSQGQQKTFVIALKLAQYQLLQQQKLQAPILLLDDVFDKLDEHRLSQIAHIFDREIEGQIFVTDTSRDRMEAIFAQQTSRPIAFFSVQDGEASRG